MPSSVENAIPEAPKLARRRVPEGGFARRSRMKKGDAARVVRRKDRRSEITGSFYSLARAMIMAPPEDC